MAPTACPIVFGSMTIGKPGTEGRVTNIEDADALLDCVQKHGHSEVNSARVCAAGTTEEFLSEAHRQERGLIMETKLYLSKRKDMKFMTPEE